MSYLATPAILPDHAIVVADAGCPDATPVDTRSDGPVREALLPLVRIGGRVFIHDNCLHFYPTGQDHRQPA